MIYPDYAPDKLGFTEIQELLKERCLSPMGKTMVDHMRMITRYEVLLKLLMQTSEFKRILEHDSPFPSSDYMDLSGFVKRIRIEGSWLNEEDFLSILKVLKTIFSIINYLKERSEIYPHLQILIENLYIEATIVKDIESVIDQYAKVRPQASEKLQTLINEITTTEIESRRLLQRLFKDIRKEGWSPDTDLTIRNGRLVIPLFSEHKRKIKGFIHDESSTGQTIFIEPTEVFDLNNKIRDLEFEKKREIIRILTDLTDNVRLHSSLLLNYHSLLSKTDFIRAKALLAVKLEANIPIVQSHATLKLFNARHPLLYLSDQKNNQTLVPLNISMNEENRIVLVSGPNAGGKSVCMKTVGLLQLMLQTGMLIPADEHSEPGIFKHILVDIGDDQSIESDLSTYSAHLTKMKYFLEQANAHTLVMIDEFGSGTDPQFGGPIAEAILQKLNQKRVKGVITTHYSNLKLFAGNTPGMINASMLFDNAQMKPLYILQTGKPGSSYAFEIAQKIGLSKEVLHLAKTKIGEHKNKVETILNDLEKDKKRLYDEKVILEKGEKRLQELLTENERLKTYFEENRKKLINDAKKEAQSIIKEANRLIENTISEIKEHQADKEQTKEARAKINRLSGQLKAEPEPEKNIPGGVIQVGDRVKMIDTEAVGTVIQINKSRAVIAIGEFLSVVKMDRLQKSAHLEQKEKKRSSYVNYQIQQNLEFNPEINVRGMRAEECLHAIEQFMDKALMCNQNTIKILHGKGNGVLRKLVRDYFRKYTNVLSIEDEHPDRGGAGLTVITFK